uniref:Small ribosomal subunit protein uS9c n=1 Tax=Codium simulans TaxID=589376 RepID=A0A1I9LKG8_9CHLO|nr:30S ribosomal protein S9 [Codium simulans]ANJ70829.1 30S ribosomal protein S9 [Codium simulans]
MKLESNLKFMIVTIGRRKNSTATVFWFKTQGILTINQIPSEEYFQNNPFLLDSIRQPFDLLNIRIQNQINIQVSGGGLSGQAQACRLALSRALQKQNCSYQTILKKKGFLTQDSRIKERRKYGLKKARKAPQFSKR